MAKQTKERKTLLQVLGGRESCLQVFGCLLVFWGLFLQFFHFISTFGEGGPGPVMERWEHISLLSSLVFIFSGAALCFLKQWAIKLALVSYGIALINNVFFCIYHFYATGFTDVAELYLALLFVTALVGWTVIRLLLSSCVPCGAEKNKISFGFIARALILLVWGGFYLSLIPLLYGEQLAARLDQINGDKRLTDLSVKIKNDPRFKNLSFFYAGLPGGQLCERGVVANAQDWWTLSEYAQNKKIFGITIDDPEIIKDPESVGRRDVMVGIGSIKKTCKEALQILLSRNSIKHYLKDSALSTDFCYVYVAPPQREKAISLLKQEPSLAGKYFGKMSRVRNKKVDSKDLIDIGFVTEGREETVVELLKKNNINNFVEDRSYPDCGFNCYPDACSVQTIYVDIYKKEKAINLLRQDPSLAKEYSSN
jgi:hypothetical protein